MSKKIFSNLLILCGILSQGIIGICSEENITESSNLHVRKKRVVDLTPDGNNPVLYLEVPYIVKIKKNGRINCAGIILSAHHILTADHCIDQEITSYTITNLGNRRLTTDEHNILRKINHISDYFTNDIALLLIDPPIDFMRSKARKVDLLIGPIPPNTTGTISSWSLENLKTNGRLLFHKDIRRIRVPIISQQECAKIYEGHFHITDKHICTFDRSQQKYCSVSDVGNPLVVFSHLAGVLTFSGKVLGAGYPDIFINLDHPIYRNWIMSNIAPHLQNHREPFNPHNLPNSHYIPHPYNPHNIHHANNPYNQHNQSHPSNLPFAHH